MEERANLDTLKDSQTFREYYYRKDELIRFCRKNHLATNGNKEALTERIAVFLDTGKRTLSITSKPKQRREEAIELTTLIEKDIVCSEKHRAFFKAYIGKSFTFNVQFQQWLKQHAGKSYLDAVMAYKKIMEDKKTSKPEIARQFEYNTYIRDYFAENKESSLQEAIQCWKYKKRQKGHHRYEKADLIALQRDRKS